MAARGLGQAWLSDLSLKIYIHGDGNSLFGFYLRRSRLVQASLTNTSLSKLGKFFCLLRVSARVVIQVIEDGAGRKVIKARQGVHTVHGESKMRAACSGRIAK